MRTAKMPITVMENIRGKELPKSWRETLKVKPEEIFKITIESNKEKESKASKKRKWAKVAEKMAKENCLDGMSEELLSKTKEFRKGFAFRVPFNQK
jgi:hypothetical protein